MKKIYCLLGFIMCAFYACLEDKGNDVYRELNDVTIERIKDTTVEQFTHLQITPEITVRDGDFNPENYTYLLTVGLVVLRSWVHSLLRRIWTWKLQVYQRHILLFSR